MQCPNCYELLATIDYEGIQIETCQSCGGQWLDDSELEHVVKVREVKFTPEQRRAIAEATSITGIKLEEVHRDLPCPKCGGTTNAINYGGDSGIIIDKCVLCAGIWLDQGELEKIQQLVEGWEDGLHGDLAQHSPYLHQVASHVNTKHGFGSSKYGFVNALMNGVLDLLRH